MQPNIWISYLGTLGFRQSVRIASDERDTQVMEQPALRFLVSVPRPGSAARDEIAVYGESAADIALAVPDVAETFTRAVAAGMGVIKQPSSNRSPTGQAFPHAVIAGPGNLRHTLSDAAYIRSHRPPGRMALDHVAFVLPRADFAAMAGAYAHTFGLAVTPLQPSVHAGEPIESCYLDAGGVTFTFLAPAWSKEGQLGRFLTDHGPGVHHLAVRLPLTGSRSPSAVAPAAPAAPFALELFRDDSSADAARNGHRCALLPIATLNRHDCN